MKRLVVCTLFCSLGLGCADQQRVQRPVALRPVPALHAVPPLPQPPRLSPSYRIGFSDAVRVTIRQDADFLACVDIDGRIDLAAYGRPRVEGLMLDEAAKSVSEAAGVAADRVTVQLIQARAARIYLHGPEQGKQRPSPYLGAERVVECLQRLGAIQPGLTNFRDVTVIRPNQALGGKPEVFHVDWLAIAQGDHSTNLILLPSDSVFIGETRRSSFSRMLPDWLVPLYRRMMGLLPPEGWPWVTEPKKVSPAQAAAR